MLKTIDSTPITQLPKTRRRFFIEGRAKINDADYAALEDCINRMIDRDYEKSKDGAITVPGWNAPGSWEGTAIQMIWDKVFPGDETLCALWYGLVYMQVLIDRDDEWIAMKTNFNREFDQMVYFMPKGN